MPIVQQVYYTQRGESDMKSLVNNLGERSEAASRLLLAAFMVLTLVTSALPARAEPPPENKAPETIVIPPEAQSLPPGFAADTQVAGNPKLESSLNQLLEVRGRDSVAEVRAFATRTFLQPLRRVWNGWPSSQSMTDSGESDDDGPRVAKRWNEDVDTNSPLSCAG
jgi:hypothetical protein